MVQPTDLLYQNIFDQLNHACILINTDVPDFTVFAINKEYKKITFKNENIIGQKVRDIFNAQEADAESIALVRECFDAVMNERRKVKLPSYRYHIPGPDGTMEQIWWQVEYSPIIDDNDKVKFILGTFKNITDEMLDKQESKYRETLLLKEAEARYKKLKVTQDELIRKNQKLSSDLEIVIGQLNKDN